MACFSRVEITDTRLESGLIPVFYDADAEKAKRARNVCLSWGTVWQRFWGRP